MKIVQLSAENFCRLSAVEITPTGHLVEISGRNAQGKSSVLNSLWAALGGKDACPAKPIRNGKERARIRLDLGEFIVTRTFELREDGDYTTQIHVESPDGARFGSPQRTIDALLGQLTFDPLEFARMDSKARFDALRRLVPSVDFLAIANADRGDFERRAELNRLAKQERAAAQSITVPADTPEQSIDETALVTELAAAGEQNALLERRTANRQSAKDKADAHMANAARLREEAADLRLNADALDHSAALEVAAAQELDKKLDEAEPLPAPVDTSHIRARIEQARAINANVRKLDERMRHHARAHGLEEQAATLTAQMEKRQADKQAAIAAAKMPIEGLTFGDGQVLFNGVPFEQASDAEQLRVSVAIAMELNPKLRVLRVRDGSLLDEDSLKQLAELCGERDFQCWIETVGDSGKCGFVIEDGRVARAPAKATAKEAAA